MKKMRRFAAIAAAAAMTACMAVPMMTGFAADETYTITINNANEGHTYEAYQIFTGSLDNEGVLGNIKWGTSVSEAAKTEYGDAAVKAATLTSQALAETFAAELADTEGYLIAAAAKDDDGTDGYVLTGLTAGYYLIVDTTDVNGKNDTVTKYIMKVSETTGVDVKTDMPTLEKKIWHNDAEAEPTISEAAAPVINTDVLASGWSDVGDNQIGDTIYYMTKTSVPDMTYYDTYKYIIHDTMSDGLTPGNVTKVVYIDKNGAAKVLNVNGAVSGQELTVDFGDLKTLLGDAAKGGYIYTYYTATLDADALISNSANSTQNNPNTAYLEFSNNPNESGTGDADNTGNTPEDIVYDWTFTFNGEKVDGEGNALAGAGFTLTAEDKIVNLIAVQPTNVNGVTAAADTLYYRVALDGEEGTATEIVTTGTANKFMILGLDDSVVYTLTETTTPGGYNTCDPVTIDLTATYTSANVLGTLTNENSDSNSATIKNLRGTQLPSTGGIGTTLFYVIGGTLAAGAGVSLIAKKRMKNEE